MIQTTMDSSNTSDDECVYLDSVSRDPAQDPDDSVQIIAEITPTTSKVKTEDCSSDSDAPVVLHIKVNDIKSKMLPYKSRKAKVNFGDFESSDASVESNGAPVVSNNGSESNNAPVVSNNAPVVSNSAQVESNNTPVVSNSAQVVSNNAPVVSNNLLTVPNFVQLSDLISVTKSVHCKSLPILSIAVESTSVNIESNNAQMESNNSPIEFTFASTKSRDSMDSEDAPTKSKDDMDSNDAPMKSKSAVDSNDVPTKSKDDMDSNDAPTESNDAPMKSKSAVDSNDVLMESNNDMNSNNASTESNVAPMKFNSVMDSNDAPMKSNSAMDSNDAPMKSNSAMDSNAAPMESNNTDSWRTNPTPSTSSATNDRDMTALAEELASWMNDHISLDLRTNQRELIRRLDNLIPFDLKSFYESPEPSIPDYNPNNLEGVPGSSGLGRASRVQAPRNDDYYIQVCLPVEDIYPPHTVVVPDHDTQSSSTVVPTSALKIPMISGVPNSVVEIPTVTPIPTSVVEIPTVTPTPTSALEIPTVTVVPSTTQEIATFTPTPTSALEIPTVSMAPTSSQEIPTVTGVPTSVVEIPMVTPTPNSVAEQITVTPTPTSALPEQRVQNAEPDTRNVDDFVFKRPAIPAYLDIFKTKMKKPFSKKKKLKRLNDPRRNRISYNTIDGPIIGRGGSRREPSSGIPTRPITVTIPTNQDPPRSILKRQRTNNDGGPPRKLRVSFVTRDDIIGVSEPTDAGTPSDDVVVRTEPRIRISEIGSRRIAKEMRRREAIARFLNSEPVVPHRKSKKDKRDRCRPRDFSPYHGGRLPANLPDLQQWYGRVARHQGNSIAGHNGQNQPMSLAASSLFGPRVSLGQVPFQGTNVVPTHGMNTVPSQYNNTVPSQYTNAIPSQGTNVVPTHGINTVPSQYTNTVPSQYTNAIPSQGTNAAPFQGTNVVPPQDPNLPVSQDINIVSYQDTAAQSTNMVPSTSSQINAQQISPMGLSSDGTPQSMAHALVFYGSGKLTLKRTENGYAVMPASSSDPPVASTSTAGQVSRGKQIAPSGNAYVVPQQDSDKNNDQSASNSSHLTSNYSQEQRQQAFQLQISRLLQRREGFGLVKQLEDNIRKSSTSNLPQRSSNFNLPNQSSTSNVPQQSSTSNLTQQSSNSNLPNQSASNVPQKSSTSNLPQQSSTSNLPQQSSTSNLPQQSSTSNLPQQSSNSNLPNQSSASNVPQKSSTSNLPQQSSTSNLPHQSPNSNLPNQSSTSNLPNQLSASNLPNQSSTSNLPQQSSTSNIPQQSSTSNLTQQSSTSNLPQQSSTSNLQQQELTDLRQELQALRAQVHNLIQKTSAGAPQYTMTQQSTTNLPQQPNSYLPQHTLSSLPHLLQPSNLPPAFRQRLTDLVRGGSGYQRPNLLPQFPAPPASYQRPNIPQLPAPPASYQRPNVNQLPAPPASYQRPNILQLPAPPDSYQRPNVPQPAVPPASYQRPNVPQPPAPPALSRNDNRSPAFDYGNLPPTSGSLGVNLVVPNQAGVVRSVRVSASGFPVSSVAPGLPGGTQVTNTISTSFTVGSFGSSTIDPTERLSQIIKRWIKHAPANLRSQYRDQLILFLHASNLVDTGLTTSITATEDRFDYALRRITEGLKVILNKFLDPTVRVRYRNRLTLFLQTMKLNGNPTQGQGITMTSAMLPSSSSAPSNAQQNPGVLANMQAFFTPAQMQHIRTTNRVSRQHVPRPIPTYDLVTLKVPGAKAMEATRTVSVQGVVQPTNGIDPNTLKLFLPENWSCHQDFNLLDSNLVHLDESSSEYQDVLQKIAKTVPNRRVKAIHRVENPFLLTMFLLKKAEMIARHGHCSEQLLYHGTHSANMFNIVVDNLDWRKFGTNVGHTYGCGVYFGSSAYIANGYARNTMFLVRVLIYWIQNGTRVTTIPAHESDTTTSTCGSVTVKYDDSTYLPEYMVTFEDLPPRQ